MSLHEQITVPFVISVGSSLFLCGWIGNTLNLLVFYRIGLVQPAIYLLFVSSFFSLIYLTAGLLTRVLSVGFSVDPTRINLTWCRTRTYLGQSSSLISLTFICYAWLDQYFLSSPHDSWRRLSQLRRTRFISLLIIAFWFISLIPFYTLAEQVTSGNGTLICSVYANYYFNQYFSYFHQPILASILPIVFIVFVGVLIHQNLSHLQQLNHRARFQHHLTSMILSQTVCIIIQTVPYGFFSMYLTITLREKKTPFRSDIESVILNMASIFYYFSHSFSFWNYFLSSSTYRLHTKQSLCHFNPMNRVGQQMH